MSEIHLLRCVVQEVGFVDAHGTSGFSGLVNYRKTAFGYVGMGEGFDGAELLGGEEEVFRRDGGFEVR